METYLLEQTKATLAFCIFNAMYTEDIAMTIAMTIRLGNIQVLCCNHDTRIAGTGCTDVEKKRTSFKIRIIGKCISWHYTAYPIVDAIYINKF